MEIKDPFYEVPQNKGINKGPDKVEIKTPYLGGNTTVNIKHKQEETKEYTYPLQDMPEDKSSVDSFSSSDKLKVFTIQKTGYYEKRI